MTIDYKALRDRATNRPGWGLSDMPVNPDVMLELLDENERLRGVIATAGKLHRKDPRDVTGKYCICEQLWPCLDAAALGLTNG